MRATLPLLPVLALLLAPPVAPVLAQEGTGARISREGPRAAPRPPAEQPAAPAAGIEDPGTLLRLAQAMVAAGRLQDAAELVERAEARLLTRSEPARDAHRPALGGTVGEVAAARAALARRDRAEAAQRLDLALSALPGASATGAPWGGPAGAAGGGREDP